MNLVANFTDGARFDAKFIFKRYGPFFLGWADAGEAFDPAVHARADDDIFEFEIDQQEGDFATLRMTVRNPRIGLLAPGRKLWAWFSWFNGTSVVPLFYGRIVGAPEQIQRNEVELSFIARPRDFVAQKEAIAEHVRQYGIWDPIWFSAEDQVNPDKILEAIPSLWNFDRVTHEVTLTDITVGEDGTLNYDETNVFDDSVSMTYAQNALRSVTVTANVSWDQIGKGTLDITHHNCTGTVRPGVIESRLGEGLTSAWPKTGSNIGGGWSFATSEITIQSGPIDASTVGEYFLDPGSQLFTYFDGGFDTSLGSTGQQTGGVPIGWSYHVAIPLWQFTYTMVLGYDVTRRKGESVTFTLVSDVQSILTEPDDQETLAIPMASSEVVALGVIAPTARSFFTTARGTQSIEYLFAVARAHLMARARAVNVSYEISFPQAVADNLSCRKNAVLSDDEFPGGIAAGKIAQYTLKLSGGKASALIRVGCMIGRAGSLVPVDGDPDYVDDDYVDPDYQFYLGQFVIHTTGDVAYESIEGLAPLDDGVDFVNLDPNLLVKRFQLLGNFTGSQEAALSRWTVVVDDKGSLKATDLTPAKMLLELKNLEAGPFQTDYVIASDTLKVPKTIDLEAAYE